MTLTKRVVISARELAILYPKICLITQDDDCLDNLVLERSSVTIKTFDSEHSYDLTEYDQKTVSGLRNIHETVISCYYKPSDGGGEIKSLIIKSYHSKTASITVESNNQDVITKILQLLEDKVLPEKYFVYSPRHEEYEAQREIIKSTINILEMIDQLQLRITSPIDNEKDFQSFLYPILRSHFYDLVDEHYLPTYGSISYKPDFGIPSAKLLIEAKVLNKDGDVKRIQKEIHDDLVGYLSASNDYRKLIVAIYNKNNAPINKFALLSLEKARGLERIIVCPSVQVKND